MQGRAWLGNPGRKVFRLALFAAFSFSACQFWNKVVARPVPDFAAPSEATDSSSASGALYHFMLGEWKQNSGDRAGAKSELEQALRLDPDSAYLHLKLARLYLQENQPAEAEREALAARRLAPEAAEPLNLLALLALNRRQVEEAMSLLKTAIQLEPDHLDAYFHLATAYLNSGSPGPAVETMRAFLSRQPHSPEGHYFLGQIFFRLEQYPAAAAEYEEALRFQPGFYYAEHELAQSYMLAGNKEQGIAAYFRLLADYPGDSDSRSVLAATLIEQERWDEAKAVLAQGKLEDETRAEWWLQSGYVELIRHNYPAAKAELTELLNRDPNNPDALFYLGVAAQLENQPAEARGWFEQVAPDSPRYAEAQRRVAWSYQAEGQSEQAREYLKGLNQKLPKVVPYYLDRAALYQETGRLDLALGVLMQGLENNPHQEDLLYQVGVVYDLMGDHDLAVVQMEKILAQNPNSARALNFIGYSWADRGIKLDEAEKLIRRALELEPDNGAIIDSLGWVFYQRRQYAEALKWLMRANEKIPGDPEISAHLGDAYCAQGNRKKALDYYQQALRALEQNPRPGLAEKIQIKLHQPRCP